MSDIQALGMLFRSFWDMYNTPIYLPIIGNTSPLKITIFLTAFSLVVGFISRLLGGDDDG